MAVIAKLFPSAQLYRCDFHWERTWERWVKEHSYGLTHSDAEIPLDLLCNCANAVPKEMSLRDQLTTNFNLS